MAISQIDKIINYIDRYGEITQRDALLLGIMRLASRISEMNKSGMHVKSERRKVTNKDGSTSYIAVYSWADKEEV